MEENKLCMNCKYMSTSMKEEPCKSCSHRCNWASPSYFKAGDIVVVKNDYRSVKNIYIYLYDGWVLRVPNYVIVRSECNYNFSTYMYKLVTEDFAERLVYAEYASNEDIIGHDHRARTFYIAETLNKWFSNLIKNPLNNLSTDNKESKKIDETFTFDTKTTYKYKPNGARYDKFPTLNANFIKRVIFSDPATIVFWEDGTKTVVKTQDGEKYDKEKGLAMAISKRVFGNERDYYNVFKRWMRKGEEVQNE